MNEWQDPLDPQPEPELFPGSLIGYRQFRVGRLSFPLVSVDPVVLRSLYRNHFFSNEHWQQAVCDNASQVSHAAPSETCRCGFYVSYLPEITFQHMSPDFEARAIVECAGKIILATKGYRASRMRIRGVAAPSEHLERLSQLFSRVVPLEEWDALVEEFPRSDYDSLLGTSVKELAFFPTKKPPAFKPGFWRDHFAAMQNSFKDMSASLEQTGAEIVKFGKSFELESPRDIARKSYIAMDDDYFRKIKRYAKFDVTATGRLVNFQDIIKDDIADT